MGAETTSINIIIIIIIIKNEMNTRRAPFPMIIRRRRRSYWFCKLCDDGGRDGRGEYLSYNLATEHHNTAHKQFLHGCGNCRKAYASKRSFILHQRANAHFESKKYICIECSTPSKNEAEFDQHRFSIHHKSPILISVTKRTVSVSEDVTRIEKR